MRSSLSHFYANQTSTVFEKFHSLASSFLFYLIVLGSYPFRITFSIVFFLLVFSTAKINVII